MHGRFTSQTGVPLPHPRIASARYTAALQKIGEGLIHVHDAGRVELPKLLRAFRHLVSTGWCPQRVLLLSRGLGSQVCLAKVPVQCFTLARCCNLRQGVHAKPKHVFNLLAPAVTEARWNSCSMSFFGELLCAPWSGGLPVYGPRPRKQVRHTTAAGCTCLSWRRTRQFCQLQESCPVP